MNIELSRKILLFWICRYHFLVLHLFLNERLVSVSSINKTFFQHLREKYLPGTENFTPRWKPNKIVDVQCTYSGIPRKLGAQCVAVVDPLTDMGLPIFRLHYILTLALNTHHDSQIPHLRFYSVLQRAPKTADSSRLKKMKKCSKIRMEGTNGRGYVDILFFIKYFWKFPEIKTQNDQLSDKYFLYRDWNKIFF